MDLNSACWNKDKVSLYIFLGRGSQFEIGISVKKPKSAIGNGQNYKTETFLHDY